MIIDAFVSKYDAQGNLLWTRQLCTSDMSKVTACLPIGWGTCSFQALRSLRKHSRIRLSSIVMLWSASTTPRANSLVQTFADNDTEREQQRLRRRLGNVYIAGTSDDSLEGSAAGAFVSKYDAAGKLLWNRQFGTADNDVCHGVWPINSATSTPPVGLWCMADPSPAPTVRLW